MKKVILSAMLLASTLALAACSTANTADVKSAEPVFEKKVTK
jgi:predicted small secreted protein